MTMDDQQLGYDAGPAMPISWTSDQLVRLEHEWRRLQRSFAYHPSVKITPLAGNPPGEYQIQFTAQTLYIRDDGQLDYAPTAAVHVWLPPGYPHEAPVVRPMQASFHPNVTMDGVAILPPWEPNRTLMELVQAVGALLVYQTYDPWNVWNPAAMDWANANPAYLPTDPQANFAPNHGGEPLGRICRNGPRTIETLRGQLDELAASMLSPDEPPSAAEVREFAERIRLATGLLLDDDIPDSLRTPAKDLDEWAEALPTTVSTFEGLRQRHIAAVAALHAAGRLAEGRRALLKELSSFEHLCADTPEVDAGRAIRQLPDLGAMQAMQTKLRVATAEAEKRLTEAKGRLAALSPPGPRVAFTHSELLEKKVEAETLRATQAVQEAGEKARAAIETIEPIIARARDEISTFDRVIGWKEYLVLTGKARELLDRIMAWGSAGVQAYFIENEGGAFGPFEFEYRVDLGDAAVAVRNTGRTALEVFDVKSGRRIGQTDVGVVTVPLAGGEPGQSFPTTFRMTARCDDLWVQVEYLTRQIGEVVLRQVKPLVAPKASSWAAAFNEILSSPPAVKGFVEQTKRGVQERAAVVSDLKLLARFKERLATQYLLERQQEMVGRFGAELAQANKDLKDSTQRIGEIFSRSQRDVETNMPMVPPKYAKEYEANKAKQENAQTSIERLTRLLQMSAAQIKPRLASVTLYGEAAVPDLQLLPPVAEAVAGRAPLLHEYTMAQAIAGLEGQLKTPLRTEEMAAAAAEAQAAADAAGQPVDETPVAEVPAEQRYATEADAPAEYAAEAPEGVDEQAVEAEPAAAEREWTIEDAEPLPSGDEQAYVADEESGEGEAAAPADDVVDFGFDPKAMGKG
ncbi:MAG TPA: hypothetical protein VEA69_13795 [Tepidisphaeraceae bacterium]|nr:hypothetical protein [Tepidisphaeraceae bacterium]